MQNMQEQRLQKAKAKVAERRKEMNAKRQNNSDKNAENREKSALKPHKQKTDKPKSRPHHAKNTKLNNKTKAPRLPLAAEDIVVGRAVNLNMGNGNMPATIVEINKDGVRVCLSNGLTMQVKAEHLCS